MNGTEARELLTEATAKVDWVNLGRVFSALGEYGFDWNKYDNSKFRPDFKRAFRDRNWLAENAGALKEAMETIKKNGKSV